MSLFEDTAWDPKYRAMTGGFGLIFVGIALAMWGGCSDAKLWMYSKSEPQTLTAAQLAAEGPGDNFHVLISDYLTSEQHYGNDEVSYCLIMPQPRASGQASIVLKTEGGNSLFGVLAPQDRLQGLVHDASGSLNADMRNALKRIGPIDFDNVWIIEHNRKPPPWWSFLLKVGGGLGLVAVGSLIFWGAAKDD